MILLPGSICPRYVWLELTSWMPLLLSFGAKFLSILIWKDLLVSGIGEPGFEWCYNLLFCGSKEACLERNWGMKESVEPCFFTISRPSLVLMSNGNALGETALVVSNALIGFSFSWFLGTAAWFSNFCSSAISKSIVDSFEITAYPFSSLDEGLLSVLTTAPSSCV